MPIEIITEQVGFLKLPKARSYIVPEEIRRLILEATDGRSDGWTATEARKQLLFIASHINKILEGR